MALFSPVQSKSATGSSAAPAATFTSTPTQGNLLLAGAFVDVASAGTITMTSSGWTALTDLHSGSKAIRLFWKVAGASEPTTVTMAGTSGPWVAAIAEYNAQGYTVNTPTDNAQSNASSTTQTTPSVTPASGKPGLAACFTAVSLADTYSGQEVNSSTTGVTVEQSPTRTGASGSLFDLSIGSTSGSYQGQSTVTTGSPGAGAIAVFTAASPTIFPPRRRPVPLAVPARSRRPPPVLAQQHVVSRRTPSKPSLLRAARGRQWSAPPAQHHPVPPTKIVRRRLVIAFGRARTARQPAAQHSPPLPWRLRVRLLPALRGRQAGPAPGQERPLGSPRAPRPYTAGIPRGRRADAATLAQTVVVMTPWPPPKLGAPLRLVGAHTRGRQVTPVPAQVPVPSPVWPNRTSALARRLFGLAARGLKPQPLGGTGIEPPPPPTPSQLYGVFGVEQLRRSDSRRRPQRHSRGGRAPGRR